MDLDERRNLLIHILEYLANRDWQRGLWVNSSQSFDPRRDFFCQIDEIVHFFLDDLELDKRSDDAIGVFFRNGEEARAAASVAIALDNCVTQLGDVADSIYVQHGCWEEVVANARQALSQMSGLT